MEELNKNQIVLLVLLVSFVTSIATGIVTVTLLDQSPPVVTQTINRIVERTIEKVEKVVPGKPPSPIIKEVPVIVTEEELIVKVINGAVAGVVRITDTNEEKSFVSSGFFVKMDGTIAASAALVRLAASTTSYQAVLSDGRAVPLVKLVLPVSTSTAASSSQLSFFKPTSPIATDKWTVFPLAKIPPAIGQTVVALGFSDRPDLNVAVGIVSSLLSASAATSPFVMTNAASPEKRGGPLLNIKGEVIGLSEGAGLAIASETIATQLALFK